MRISKDKVMSLMQAQGISQNQLAGNIGICRGSLSNALSGRRNAGRKLLAGLIRQFPNESVASLIVNERQVNQS